MKDINVTEASTAALATNVKLAQFTCSRTWWLLLWGGGHTTDTDPSQKGWLAKPVRGTGNVLVGRRGIPGCFSARPMPGRYPGDPPELDVGFYWETPEWVQAAWLRKDPVDCSYKTLQDISGWGLEAIQHLEAEMRAVGLWDC